MPSDTDHSPIWNIPNALSAARIPLAIGIFVAVSFQFWAVSLGLFLIAILTDWLDGWWARRYGPLTLIGRNLDPLTDKFLICGTFIYLLIEPQTGIAAWMVTLVVGREILITGVRGIVEATGAKFGADWFGKLKTVLQCVAILAILGREACRSIAATDVSFVVNFLNLILPTLVGVMLVATFGSGVQYLVKASRLLALTSDRKPLV